MSLALLAPRSPSRSIALLAALAPLALGCLIPVNDGADRRDGSTEPASDGGTSNLDGGCAKTGTCPKKLKPDLMFLLGRTATMIFPMDTAAAACPARCNNGGPDCPPGCPLRMDELRLALDSFLNREPTVARMGLALFPADPLGYGNTNVLGCGPTGSLDIPVPLSGSNDVDTELAATAMEISLQLPPAVVKGGRPIADSLRYVGSQLGAGVPGRARFILLVTDGLPNCNGNNPNSCNGTNCRCTTTSCTVSPLCRGGCLDADNAIAAVSELQKAGIRTIVVGIGAETLFGDARTTFQAMAQAGGAIRRCPSGTDVECGTNNSCDRATNLCTRKYYQAANASELSAALTAIAKTLY